MRQSGGTLVLKMNQKCGRNSMKMGGFAWTVWTTQILPCDMVTLFDWLCASGVHLEYIKNIYGRKFGSTPTKFKIDLKPNWDSMDGNQGEETKLASKPYIHLGERQIKLGLQGQYGRPKSFGCMRRRHPQKIANDLDPILKPWANTSMNPYTSSIPL